LEPPSASLAELGLIHQADYISAVQRLSLFADDPMTRAEATAWGLGRGDCPAFLGMHDVSAAIAGGSLHAVRGVLDGSFQHAFNPAGGLHHAMANLASGFCIYNDAAVGIADAVQRSEARVLYLDFDVHHGDGVQAAFYDEPRVLTLSFHETGRHLFPGTGSVYELGEGLGRGFSLNLPVQPFTEDGSWLAAIEELVPLVAERMTPDLIVSQHGCDTHAWDPLAHVRLSTRAYAAQTRLVHELAHRVAGGRWVALGGGGYDWVRVVPRSWSIVWAEMSGRALPEKIPEDWTARWSAVAEREQFSPMVTTFLDDVDAWPAVSRRVEIEQENRDLVETVRDLAAPALLRQAFSGYRAGVRPPGGKRLIQQLGGSYLESRAEAIDTPRGRVELREFCPPSLLERLKPDPGLSAFVRRPESEYELLRKIAANPRCALNVAHTTDGVIVGQVTLAEGEYWWADLDRVLELSLETSRGWRRMGIAGQLLRFTVAPEWVEEVILVAVGLVWHWDVEGMDGGAWSYRAMLRRMFERHGFEVMATAEPNVRMSQENILLVRVGTRTPPAARVAFEEALTTRPAARRAAG
jgi:acetoin utilization deacetylase AcuC-like enzyme